MIPNYQQFMRPFLEIAYQAKQQGEDEVKLRDVINALADHFHLTEEERSETLPSGRQLVIDNRIGWARTYLTKAGLLEATRRAHFVITERGIQAVQSKSPINNAYLKQFDEFIAFKTKSNDDASASTEVYQAQEVADNEDEITPDEALRIAYRKINESLSEDILARTRKVTPAFFENLLIELLLAMGYGGTGDGAATALGKSGDNGVDGVIDQDPLGVDQIYIQAKRYSEGNNVGAGEIRDFFGALNLKRAQKGIFITTSDFTPAAIDTAQNLGNRIVLINGTDLAKLMLRYNIGSRDEQVLYLMKIDCNPKFISTSFLSSHSIHR